jgi:hypothetical protein
MSDNKVMLHTQFKSRMLSGLGQGIPVIKIDWAHALKPYYYAGAVQTY